MFYSFTSADFSSSQQVYQAPRQSQDGRLQADVCASDIPHPPNVGLHSLHPSLLSTLLHKTGVQKDSL